MAKSLGRSEANQPRAVGGSVGNCRKESRHERGFFLSVLNLKVILFSAVWLLAIGSGGFALLRYQQTPGGTSVAPGRWPRESRLTSSATLPTLLLFAHPKCPCTRATLGELAALMLHGAGKVSVTVGFTRPPGMDDAWVETGLWRNAATIPGVVVVRDDLGVEAARFGATTSGDAMLFARAGKLLFHGGITSGRRHAGDNDGRSAILALIQREPTAFRTTLVFGCPLFSAKNADCQLSKPLEKAALIAVLDGVSQSGVFTVSLAKFPGLLKEAGQIQTAVDEFDLALAATWKS